MVENTKKDFFYRSYDTYKDICISFAYIKDTDWKFAKTDVKEELVKEWLLKNQMMGYLLDLDCVDLKKAIPVKK